MIWKSLLEKYEYWKKGQVLPYTSLDMQELFKSNVTQDQVMLLDKIMDAWTKRKENLWLIMLVAYLVLGMFIGYLISYGRF